ncbi:MAG: hypothetical protein WC863_04020 [Patescibacteria group bacterium]
MITLDLSHLFKTDPNSTKIPRLVFNWVIEREKQFPGIEFQISFWGYKSENEKQLGLKFERTYGPSILNLRNVTFPLSEGYWVIKLIGDQRNTVIASGLTHLLENKDSRVQLIPSDNERTSPRGYTRINPISAQDEEMVDIRCDRNTNDEWTFRGTGQEFMDEIVSQPQSK